MLVMDLDSVMDSDSVMDLDSVMESDSEGRYQESLSRIVNVPESS